MKAATIIRRHRGKVFVEACTGEDMIEIECSKTEAIRFAGILEDCGKGAMIVTSIWGEKMVISTNHGNPTEML